MANEMLFTPEEQVELDAVLVASGSKDKSVSVAATQELATALELPLRKGTLSGDITFNIFEPIKLTSNATSEFPLDWLAPGTEKNYVAFTMPHNGYIPQKSFEGDYVQVPIYDIGAAIDWHLKYARDARWDIVGRAMEVMRGQFVKKMNDDGWHTILSAGLDRNIVVVDSDAAAGQFTKRLISLMKVVMRRNGGGNSASNRRSKLTDVFVSPEAMEDIRNWGVDQIADITRDRLFNTSADNVLNNLFGVNLHDLDELGEGQEYQLFYDNQLSGTLPSGDVELVVGLDLTNRDSFVNPIREAPQIFVDDSMHRSRRTGLYGWAEGGYAVLDNRRVLLGSL